MCDFRQLRGGKGFDLLLLGDFGAAFLELDFKPLVRCLHRGAAYGHFAFGIDRGAFLFRCGDHFGQSAHADGVKGVVFVKGRERRLIERGERDRIEMQAISRQGFG